jgi:hypothetical protein
MTITIGADPEFFLAKDGVFVSAHDLIPGSKAKPHPVKGGAVQPDGLAAEFNIEPSSSFLEFKESIQSVMSQLLSITEICTPLEQVTVEFDPTTIPDKVLVIGCGADFNPYEEVVNEKAESSLNYRSAGGHIHIGGINLSGESPFMRYSNAIRMARLMDKYVGVYSSIWDKDKVRRTTYGKAGNCRIKPYGVEYRALSNAWLFNETVMEFVYTQTMKACEAFETGEDGDTYFQKLMDMATVNHPFYLKDKTAKDLIKCLSENGVGN